MTGAKRRFTPDSKGNCLGSLGCHPVHRRGNVEEISLRPTSSVSAARTDLRQTFGAVRLWRIAGALLILAASAGAQRPRIGPNGDGTLLRNDDQRWLLLQQVKIFADTEKGIYRAVFSPSLARAEGATLHLSGYLLPVETASKTSHFVITRRSLGCPFCAPPGLTEAVEVFASTPVSYTVDPVTVQGRLHLSARSESGLFYRLDTANAE